VRLAPTSIAFGTLTQGVIATAQTLTLTSSGTSALHISSVAIGGTNANDFILANNCSAAAYAVGATCTIGVSVSPLIVGPRTALVTITDDASNSPQTIPVTATVNPAFAISPAGPGSTSVTVTAGQTADFNLQLTPGPGFAGSASFACSGVPAQAACTAPNAQFAGGTPVMYVVSVATTKSSVIPIPRQLPPFIWFRVLLLLACCTGFVRLALVFNSRGLRGLPRALALATLTLFCLFEFAGCGGGAGAVTPQNVPTPQVIGTPQGTSVITVTPVVTTAGGIALQGVPPIQLTLTVQ
jgi:hypothetical protein